MLHSCILCRSLTKLKAFCVLEFQEKEKKHTHRKRMTLTVSRREANQSSFVSFYFFFVLSSIKFVSGSQFLLFSVIYSLRWIERIYCMVCICVFMCMYLIIKSHKICRRVCRYESRIYSGPYYRVSLCEYFFHLLCSIIGISK